MLPDITMYSDVNVGVNRQPMISGIAMESFIASSQFVVEKEQNYQMKSLNVCLEKIDWIFVCARQ